MQRIIEGITKCCKVIPKEVTVCGAVFSLCPKCGIRIKAE